ncbi:phospholipase D family protein [Noviherbaspirillum malthae]|uniref:phospholipase D family protein n=1 Tax=Noviherbaspirillum malthae TaxID=1260987 RepID=UPI00188E1C17|nr:phospholipase D family protein [Noviherbaspirillum malthae]
MGMPFLTHGSLAENNSIMSIFFTTSWARIMFLDSGRAIAEKIQELIDEEVYQPVRMAVAFWGAGADYKLRGRCELICDLDSGACNPAVIRALLQRDNCVVLKLDGLHAKVVIGSTGAVVSSANMSTNGLGAEGADASGTIEAGYFVSEKESQYERIVSWFKSVWEKASEITESDLAKAQQKWDFRNREMPVAGTPEPQSESEPYHINPFTLLEERIDPADRLRAVKPMVFNQLRDALPHVDHRRQGKIATWACHLLLNQAGIVLDHSSGNGEGQGPATDHWIVGRFGTDKKDDTVENVQRFLEVMTRDTEFSKDIRRAARQVLVSKPWLD